MKKKLDTKKTHAVEKRKVNGMVIERLRKKYNITQDEIINIVGIILFLIAAFIVVVVT